MISERTFDWLLSLQVGELLDLFLWISFIIKAKLQGAELSYSETCERFGALVQPQNRRRNRRRRASSESTNFSTDTSPGPNSGR